MQRSESKGWAYAMITSAIILWGGSNVAVKFALRDLPPFTIGAFRFVLSSLILVRVLAWQEKGVHLPHRGNRWILVFLGLVGIFGSNALFQLGFKFTTASNGSLIFSGSPIVIAVLSAFLLKERIHLRQLIGIILSLLGIMIVISKGTLSFLTSMQYNIGDIILIGSITCWALYVVFSKKVMDRISALALSTYSTVIGAVFFIPPMIFELVSSTTKIHFTITSMVAIGYMGLLASPLSSFLWNRGLAVVGASQAGIFLNGVPIVTMLLSVMLLGETITYAHILGAVLVFGGVFLTSQRE